jgi:hypothetical protein
MPKKVQGSHAGIYVFDRIDVPQPKYPVAYFSNTDKNGFDSDYAMDIDIFIELGRPDKIRVHDLVEVIK